jgi:hypothetical protein
MIDSSSEEDELMAETISGASFHDIATTLTPLIERYGMDTVLRVLVVWCENKGADDADAGFPFAGNQFDVLADNLKLAEEAFDAGLVTGDYAGEISQELGPGEEA